LRLMDGWLLSSDFGEVINIYNAWAKQLNALWAWKELLQELGDDDNRWGVQHQFVSPLAYFCMHQPASLRDLILRFGTMAFHLGNLNGARINYKDQLPQDRKIFERLQKDIANASEYFLSRTEGEKQLRSVSQGWEEADSFLSNLKRLNAQDYKSKTKDWRNRATHFIAPRLDRGHVQPVRRRVAFREVKVFNPDGSFTLGADKKTMQICYDWGGDEPLNLSAVVSENQIQCEIARSLLSNCESVLRRICLLRSRELSQ
jgi:hypothetical protein